MTIRIDQLESNPAPPTDFNADDTDTYEYVTYDVVPTLSIPCNFEGECKHPDSGKLFGSYSGECDYPTQMVMEPEVPAHVKWQPAGKAPATTTAAYDKEVILAFKLVGKDEKKSVKCEE